MDAAELETVRKTVYNSASWRAAKPERVKGGKLIPAQTPTIFPTEKDAQQTLERFHRLGTEAGVPMAGHLAYGVVAPMDEWESTNGQPTADREREQVQAEVEVETLEVRAREAAEALERAKERVSASRPAATTSSSDWIGVPGEKGIQTRTRADGSVVYRHRGGETVDSLAEATRDRDGQQPSREAIEALVARAEAS